MLQESPRISDTLYRVSKDAHSLTLSAALELPQELSGAWTGVPKDAGVTRE